MYFLSKLLFFAVAAVDVLLVHGAPTPIEDSKTSELDRRALPAGFSGVSTTSRRLFQFSGKTQYFAGLFVTFKIILWRRLICFQVQMLGG